MNCLCGSKTKVTTTEQHTNNVLRRRKCLQCKQNFMTLESRYTKKPKIQTVEKNVLIPVAKVKEKNRLTTIRRRNIEDKREQRKSVPSYFIEDEWDD
jgi:transcriptional regulator NrdR family protein